MKINVETKFNQDRIEQILTETTPLDVTHEIARYAVNLREKGIRDALIKLGWTPPPEERG